MFSKVLASVAAYFVSLPSLCKEIAAAVLFFLPAAAFLVAVTVLFAAKKLRARSKLWYLFFSESCCLLFAAFSLLSREGDAVIAFIAAALLAEGVYFGLFGLLCLFGKERAKKRPKKKRQKISEEEISEDIPLSAPAVGEDAPAVGDDAPADRPFSSFVVSKPQFVRCFAGGGESAPKLRSLEDVRFDYVLSVFERLREMKLGAGDRLEAEKMGELLEIYKNKGALCEKECETLNDILASLLKMMAKYDV